MRQIIIFDTTLRDGEQSPGASLNTRQKLEIARALAQLKVDVIEAGFPIASPDDFEAVRRIAQEIEGPTICGLARTLDADIDRAAEAVRPAKRPRIHVFCATSEIHRTHKLRKAKEEIVRLTEAGVKRARSYTDDVEFSPEDASRTEPDFLVEVVTAAIEAGATTINIPDTVGYALPQQFGPLIRMLKERVPNMDQAVISVHCHNDLGLGVPTRSPRWRPAPTRWSARSTGSARGRVTPHSKRWSWRSGRARMCSPTASRTLSRSAC